MLANEPSRRHIAREPLEDELCLSSLSSPLLDNKPSGRHIAREPLVARGGGALAFARSLGGVGQPQQLLAQRGLGARQQVGSRQVATARRAPHSSSGSTSSSSPNASVAVHSAKDGGTRRCPGTSESLATAEATHAGTLRASLLTRRRSATRFAMSAFQMLRLQRGEEGQGCSWRDRAAGTEQGARDLLERRQRRVDLERLRKRHGARLADLVVPQAAAR